MTEAVNRSTSFFRFCVLKLGLIYIFLAVATYSFVHLKLSYGFWWMSGVVFAMSDKIAFALFFSMATLFLYGIYSWLKAFRFFVFFSGLNSKLRFYSAGYLILAPTLAAWITSELYQVLLIDPFWGYEP